MVKALIILSQYEKYPNYRTYTGRLPEQILFRSTAIFVAIVAPLSTRLTFSGLTIKTWRAGHSLSVEHSLKNTVVESHAAMRMNQP
jgi:hypothetical protein